MMRKWLVVSDEWLVQTGLSLIPNHQPLTTVFKELSTMYTVAITRDFVAQHFLIGGDWGAENQWHSHHYQVEVRLEGATLDQHGYLVDIVDIETNLEAMVDYFRDK